MDQTGPGAREVARIEMDDLLKPWPYKSTEPLRSPPSPENIPPVFSADDQDDPYSDIYTNATQRYRYAQDVYLMFPSFFRHFAPTRSRQPWFDFQHGGSFGLLDVQMAVRHDGTHLRVNIDTGGMGTAFVEVLDAGGKPLAGLCASRLRGGRRQLPRRGRSLERAFVDRRAARSAVALANYCPVRQALRVPVRLRPAARLSARAFVGSGNSL